MDQGYKINHIQRKGNKRIKGWGIRLTFFNHNYLVMLKYANIYITNAEALEEMQVCV